MAPGEAIQIRSMQVLTVLGDLGAPSQRGVAMVLADYGPIMGHDVLMGAGLDSLCAAEGGRAAETVIGHPRVVGVIGSFCSVAAAAASPLLSQAGLVMISPSTTSPSPTSDLRGNAGSNYHPGYYRTASNDLYQARAVAEFAYNELGLRNMATIDDGEPYTSGLTVAFATVFQELSGSVTTAASVRRGDTDMLPVLSQISDGSPDGLFFPLFTEEGAAVVRQVGRTTRLEDVTLIGGTALLVSEFLAIPESEGIYLPGPDLDFSGNVNEETGRSGEDLVAGYQELYGAAPSSAYLPHAYDATTMLLRAIEDVAVSDGDTLYIDRAGLREALTGLTGFMGVIGVISCDEFGDCGVGRVQIALHADSSVTDIAGLPVVYRFAP